MAEKGKVKKVEARDTVRNMLADLIMRGCGMDSISRTKEGLVVNVGEQDLIVRVIQKKSKIEKADIVEVITLDSLDGEDVVEDGEAEEVAGE